MAAPTITGTRVGSAPEYGLSIGGGTRVNWAGVPTVAGSPLQVSMGVLFYREGTGPAWERQIFSFLQSKVQTTKTEE